MPKCPAPHLKADPVKLVYLRRRESLLRTGNVELPSCCQAEAEAGIMPKTLDLPHAVPYGSYRTPVVRHSSKPDKQQRWRPRRPHRFMHKGTDGTVGREWRFCSLSNQGPLHTKGAPLFPAPPPNCSPAAYTDSPTPFHTTLAQHA